MKIRKGSILALTMAATGLAGFTLALADDEGTKTHQAMEKVQGKNAYIVKNLKTAAVFKKNQKEIAEAAKALATLGKEVRDETDASKEAKQPQAKWVELMDSYIKESETFASEVAKSDITQPVAKDKFKKVTATCTACHKDFRKDD